MKLVPAISFASTKNNHHENKNEINSIIENMGGDLSKYHTVLLPLWTGAISSAIISKDIPANNIIGAMDDVCRCAIG